MTCTSPQESETGHRGGGPGGDLEQGGGPWHQRVELGPGTGVRHVRPTAEDFAERFEWGGDPTRLAALDTSGVALAAIQGPPGSCSGGMPK